MRVFDQKQTDISLIDGSYEKDALVNLGANPSAILVAFFFIVYTLLNHHHSTGGKKIDQSNQIFLSAPNYLHCSFLFFFFFFSNQ
jgi:hypothetical protein